MSDDMDKPGTADLEGTAPDADQDSSGLLRWNTVLDRVARHRDRQAFRELFDHFGPLIKAFAWKVSSPDQADSLSDDLVQETMLKVWTKAETFNAEMASASTWIFTIARNTRIDLIRRTARHHQNTVSVDSEENPLERLETDDLWLEKQDTDVFNLLARQRSRRQIIESMKSLPREQADILRKVYMEDKSHSEVALELDLPLGTVKSRVRLALKKMQLTVDR